MFLAFLEFVHDAWGILDESDAVLRSFEGVSWTLDWDLCHLDFHPSCPHWLMDLSSKNPVFLNPVF